MKPVSLFPALFRRALLLFPLALVVVACASTDEVVIIDQKPNGITLRADDRYPTMAGVEADEHCAKYGKFAVLAKKKHEDPLTHPYTTTSVYDCVDTLK